MAELICPGCKATNHRRYDTAKRSLCSSRGFAERGRDTRERVATELIDQIAHEIDSHERLPSLAGFRLQATLTVGPESGHADSEDEVSGGIDSEDKLYQCTHTLERLRR